MTRLVNLHTSDIRVAKDRRDELEAETSQIFMDARAGRTVAGTNKTPAERGQLWREAIMAIEADHDAEDDLLHSANSAQQAEWERLSDQERRDFEDARFGRGPVEQFLEDYLASISSLAPATRLGRRGHVRRFAAWCKTERLKLIDVDRKTAGRYVTERIQPLHHKTAGEHLSTLRSYWNYLSGKGHVTDGDKKGGPWADQLTPVRPTRAQRGDQDVERPFTEEEVRTLLYSPYPLRMNPDHQSQLADALRISLLSGMRLEEVLTLWVEEIRDGMFDIQQGKTEAAARRVPIHPDLTELVERRMKGKGPKDWLFHELRSERDPGDTFGKRFRRYRVKLGVNEKRTGKRRSLVNFHSARHWFTTGASHAGQAVETIGSVVGHRSDKKKSVTFAVYIKTASDAQKRACVESVVLPLPSSTKGPD